MSELIDRQALIKQLKDENIPFNSDINEIINIQPIAFDVDRVIEEIARRDTTDGNVKVFSGIEIINIVKQEINNGLE